MHENPNSVYLYYMIPMPKRSSFRGCTLLFLLIITELVSLTFVVLPLPDEDADEDGDGDNGN